MHDAGAIVLFASVHSGLANRLRALIGYEALARVRGRPFALCWRPERACDAAFTDLFEPPDFPLLTEAEARHLLDTGRAELFADPRWFYHIRQDHAPDVPWLRFLAEARASLAALRPAAAVRRAVDAFRVRHDLSDTLGVHVRLTDNIEAQALFAVRGGGFDASRLSAVEGFMAAIRGAIATSKRSTLPQSPRTPSTPAESALAPSKPVLLATDNPEFERRCLATFGDGLLVYPKLYRFEWPAVEACATGGPADGRADGAADGTAKGAARAERQPHASDAADADNADNGGDAGAARRTPLACVSELASPHGDLRTTAVSDALIELLLLGACRSVLGTYFSSFSKLAAVWGEVDYLEMAGTMPAPHPETSRVIAGLRALGAGADVDGDDSEGDGDDDDRRRGVKA